MPLESRQQVEDHALAVWSGDELAQALCRQVIAVLSERAATARMLTYRDLAGGKSPGAGEYAAKLIAVAKYFTGDDLPLLTPQFAFIDDDTTEDTLGATAYSISEVNRFQREGFVHPESGDVVPDAMDKLYMYFVPTALAKTVFGRER